MARLQLLQIANRYDSHRTGDDDDNSNNVNPMVQNPDEVSGGSDQDDSDLECDTGGRAARPDDSDGEEAGDEDMYGGGADYTMNVPDDDDDEDDEDDELPPTAAPKSQPTSGGGGGGGGGAGGSSSNGVGTMDKFLMKPSEVAQHKRKLATQTKEATKSNKHKTVRTGSASAPDAGAPPKPPKPTKPTKPIKPTKPSEEGREEEEQQSFALHSDESDEDAPPLQSSVPQKRGVSLPPPPDCMQEFENQRTNGLPSAAANDAAPKVHPDALSIAYVMKNEKVNKWWKLDPSLLVYAPDPRKTVPYTFAMEDLTIASKPVRDAMQKKLCNADPNWLANSAVIFKLPTDGNLDLPLADAPGIVMAVPYLLKQEGDKKLGDFRSRLATEDGTTPDVILGMLALGIDTIKAAYAVKQCPLPSLFDPTRPLPSTSAKWKVPSKLEEHLRTTADDDRFLLGALEKPKRTTSHKRTNDDASRGGKADGKADGKRSANGATVAALAAGTGASPAEPASPPDQDGALPEHGEDTVSICGNPALMKVFASKDFATSYAELRCKADQRFTVCQAGPGKFILLLGPVARS